MAHTVRSSVYQTRLTGALGLGISAIMKLNSEGNILEFPNSRCWRTNALYNGITISPYEAKHLVCCSQFCFYACVPQMSARTLWLFLGLSSPEHVQDQWTEAYKIRLNNVPPYSHRHNNTFPRMELQEPSFWPLLH